MKNFKIVFKYVGGNFKALYIKFNKSSKYVIDQWKMDNKFGAFVRKNYFLV